MDRSIPMWAHGRFLEGKPVAVIGQGPSLSEADIEKIQIAEIPVIAIKDSSRYVRDPVVIYACDRKWWQRRWKDERYEYLKNTTAVKLVMAWQMIKDDIPDLRTIGYDGIFGLSFKDGMVRHGRNSGYQMVNFAINAGASSILLHGFDCRIVDGKSHGIPDHVATHKTTFADFVGYFNTMKHDLDVWGGKVYNTCMTSAIEIFPKIPLESAIKIVKDEEKSYG
jgi:hypothetical protein